MTIFNVASAFGDSISTGYAASVVGQTDWLTLLHQAGLASTVRLRGYGGHSSADLVMQSLTYYVVIDNPQPDLVLLQAPADNDVYVPGLQVDQAAENICILYHQLRRGLPKARIVVWSPPPRTPDTISVVGFHQTDFLLWTQAVCIRDGLEFFDLRGDFIARCAAQNIPVTSALVDGVHPNDAGHQIMCAAWSGYFGLQ